MSLTTINPKDLVSIRQAIQKLSSLRLGPKSTPTFASMSISGLAASLLVQTDGSKILSSVTDLTSWIAGTTNQVAVTDDSDGTVTLSLPQDYHTGASPTLAGLTLTEFDGIVTAESGILSASNILDLGTSE